MLEDPENPSWSDASVEFCGGTHLSNTQEAEAFVILEEVYTVADNKPPPYMLALKRRLSCR